MMHTVDEANHTSVTPTRHWACTITAYTVCMNYDAHSRRGEPHLCDSDQTLNLHNISLYLCMNYDAHSSQGETTPLWLRPDIEPAQYQRMPCVWIMMHAVAKANHTSVTPTRHWTCTISAYTVCMNYDACSKQVEPHFCDSDQTLNLHNSTVYCV